MDCDTSQALVNILATALDKAAFATGFVLQTLWWRTQTTNTHRIGGYGGCGEKFQTQRQSRNGKIFYFIYFFSKVYFACNSGIILPLFPRFWYLESEGLGKCSPHKSCLFPFFVLAAPDPAEAARLRAVGHVVLGRHILDEWLVKPEGKRGTSHLVICGDPGQGRTGECMRHLGHVDNRESGRQHGEEEGGGEFLVGWIK